MVRSMTVLILLFGAPMAAAHESWISGNNLTDPDTGAWCCNHVDCAALPNGGVKENTEGVFVAETSETIPHKRVIWKSQDGLWWRCRNMTTNATRCLIGPPRGF